MTVSLKLTAHAQSATIPAGGPLRIDVTLSNPGAAPVWVNGRLAVDYPDALIRELYLTVDDLATGQRVEVADDVRIDAHRMPATRDDFRELAAGGSMSATVDAGPWFPTRSPGRYRVVVTYVNDDPGAAHGLAAFTGEVAAPPFEIAVEPPTP